MDNSTTTLPTPASFRLLAFSSLIFSLLALTLLACDEVRNALHEWNHPRVIKGDTFALVTQQKHGRKGRFEGEFFALRGQNTLRVLADSQIKRFRLQVRDANGAILGTISSSVALDSMQGAEIAFALKGNQWIHYRVFNIETESQGCFRVVNGQ